MKKDTEVKLYMQERRKGTTQRPRIAQRDVSSEKKRWGMTASKGLKKNE